MRKLLPVFFILTLPFSALAQEILKEAALRYIITDIHTRKDGTSSRIVQPYLFAYTPDEFRSWKKWRENIRLTNIFKCGDSLPIVYISNGEKSNSVEDQAKIPLFDMGRMQERQTTIRYTNESASISGVECRKAVMTLLLDGKAEEIEVWYNPTYRLQPGCFDYFFNELKGLPVSIRFTYHSPIQIKGLNMSTTREYLLDSFYTTESLRLIPQPDEKIYVRVDKQDFMNIFSEMMSNRNGGPPKGKPITEKVKTADGISVTRTRFNPFTVGDTLAPFAGTGMDDRPRNSADYTNKPMVINFWFTRCAPCVQEMPMLNKVAETYKERNVSFISITYNPRKEVDDFLQKNSFVFDHIPDARDLIDQYGVSSYPATIVTDKNHIITYIKIGSFASEAELAGEVEKVL